jgi:hypothetical protein
MDDKERLNIENDLRQCPYIVPANGCACSNYEHAAEWFVERGYRRSGECVSVDRHCGTCRHHGELSKDGQHTYECLQPIDVTCVNWNKWDSQGTSGSPEDEGELVQTLDSILADWERFGEMNGYDQAPWIVKGLRDSGFCVIDTAELAALKERVRKLESVRRVPLTARVFGPAADNARRQREEAQMEEASKKLAALDKEEGCE